MVSYAKVWFYVTELIKRHSKNIDKVNNLSRNVSDYKEVLNSQIMHNFVILLLLQTKEIKTVNWKYSVLIAKKLKILYTCLINAKLQITWISINFNKWLILYSSESTFINNVVMN